MARATGPGVLAFVVLVAAACGDEPVARVPEAPATHAAPAPEAPTAPADDPAAEASAPQAAVATVEAVGGSVELSRPPDLGPLAQGARLLAYDAVFVRDAAGSVTIAFEDGTRMTMRAPGGFGLREAGDGFAARVWLVEGALEVFDPAGGAVEVDTPYDVTATLRGAPAQIALRPGAALRIERRGPGNITVRTGRESVELGDEPWDHVVPNEGLVAECSGTVRIHRGSESEAATPGARLAVGDAVELLDRARARITFPDGGRLDLVGPGRIGVVELTAQGRRVLLAEGVLDVRARGIALEVQAPRSASLVLQNASARVEARRGEPVAISGVRGDYAKVYRDGSREVPLTDGRCTID